MNGEPRHSPRPLLLVLLVVATATSVITAFRSGLVQLQVRWPEDQPAAPMVAAFVLVVIFLLALFLILSGRRAPSRTNEPMQPTSGPRSPTRPSRIGLVAERPPTRFSDVAGADEA